MLVRVVVVVVMPLLPQELTNFDLMLGLSINCSKVVVVMMLRSFLTGVGLRATNLRLQILQLVLVGVAVFARR